jgi:arsenate reductase (thioredoxin)
MRILILCTGNSGRSQMAHGFLQSFDPRIVVRSAGTDPAPKVSAKTISVMKEEGIILCNNIPRNVNQYLGQSWDYVITVCDNAYETCPAFPGKVENRIHIPFEDPSKLDGTEDQKLEGYRRIRDQIKISFYRFYCDYLIPVLA